MSYRQFTDENGTTWQVWDVVPQENERRHRERRVVNQAAEDDRRDIWDRRGDLRGLVELPPELLDGWLVFRSEQAKRRFWPVPVGWQNLSLDELRDLCRNATVVSLGGSA